MTIIMSSNPARTSVLPHGGREPVISPNPVAVRIPTESDPIILETSMSTVSNGTVTRAKSLGENLPSPVLLDTNGELTNDPSAIADQHQGGILPLGGLEFGYKGFGLGLMVEALTSGLAGSGRRLKPEGLGASVFVMSLAPGHFSGRQPFIEELQFLAESCQSSPPRPRNDRVRLPGSAALSRRRERTRNGIPLPRDVVDELAAATFAVDLEFDVDSLQWRSD